jgi:hypothetical protein
VVIEGRMCPSCRGERPDHRARAGVAVIPGSASGDNGHIRISFAGEIAQL